jgi:glycosyltransferase involved in cell wall biosynthesis
MPDSENVSQGGPANFAKLFHSYLQANTKNRWIGLMYQTTKTSKTLITNTYNFNRRNYYKLSLPKKTLKNVTQAIELKDPSKILKKPIDLLLDVINDRKPDIVFLNGFGLINWILLKAANKAGVPVVIQHAGIWTKELEIHKSTYSKFGRKIMEIMEEDSTRFTNGEVFLNEWSRDYYCKNIARRNDDNTCIIPLPFNFANFKRLGGKKDESQFYFDLKKFHIGMIARWDDIKNHKLILALAKEIEKNGLPWQIHVITDIPDLPKYQKIKNEYEKYIDVVAPLDRSGISDFCNSVDLLIQPSLFDVSPTVVLEAIASKTPIAISENVGYVSDFKKYGAKDWILSNKAAMIISQIKKIANQPMPTKLRRHLRSAHDNNKVFAAYLKLFTKVVNNRKANLV